ncbi:MAG: hypothetical protein A2042_06620 [Candidatus Schekmanbacteria bacterium GWA2_38_11]|uniref:Glycosyltransferase 2-like domain-containing protein n=1 Tax=Candidatus Schekmanbacteria bacterium GWA2_38_11 TaxID=1817876 RepID=A0A1F7RKH0_9BACT|nr:MAG: hypothetical protein A2042_06620 [Candidatus Schekmanbacteria bacterium GWA2_38_11]
MFKKSQWKENETNLPFVTLLIPVHNEERVIRRKIENTLALDYPKGKLEIIIASDASNDKTDSIIKGYEMEGIIFYREEERSGKNVIINNSIPKIKGELIVFSDANSIYKPDAIKNLVKNFQDPKVGCVCGKLIYVNDKGSLVGKGESLYFKYESMLKNLESNFGVVVTGNGAIYAIRRDLLFPLPNEVPNDFAHPIEVRAKGFKVVYEPSAIAEEKATSSIKDEFKRRVRIVVRSFSAFIYYQKKYNILKSRNSFFFISHKLLRWFVFPLMIMIFSINFFLTGYFYQFFFKIQLLFYMSALIGWVFQEIKIKIKIFYIPFYFCLINLAGTVGLYKYFIGKRETIWEAAESTR